MRLSVQQTFLAASAGRKKKAKVASAATTLVMYGLIGVLIILSMGAVYAGMVVAAVDGESDISVYGAVTVANILGSAMTLFLGTMGLATHVFKCRDFDFLMSLPVTPSQVLWSKLVGQYVSLLYYSTVFVLPSYIVVFALGNVDIMFCTVLSMILNLLLLPMIPLAVSVILAFFVSLIPENNVLGKVVSTLLSLGLVGLYMWFFYGGDGMTQLMINPAVTNAMKKIYFPLALLDNAVGGNFVSLLLYVAASVGICAVVVGLLAFAYFPIIRRRRQGGGKRRKLEKTDIKASRVDAALYSKELKKYFMCAVQGLKKNRTSAFRIRLCVFHFQRQFISCYVDGRKFGLCRARACAVTGIYACHGLHHRRVGLSRRQEPVDIALLSHRGKKRVRRKNRRLPYHTFAKFSHRYARSCFRTRT